MGRWAMYRRRGGSPAPSGLLVLNVVNAGGGIVFFVDLSGDPNLSGSETFADFTIDGLTPVFIDTSGPNQIELDLPSPASASGLWNVSGPLMSASPLLFPQNGSY